MSETVDCLGNAHTQITILLHIIQRDQAAPKPSLIFSPSWSDSEPDGRHRSIEPGPSDGSPECVCVVCALSQQTNRAI